MPLRPIPRESEWPDEILELAREEFWAKIEVVDPSTETPGTYNPVTDEVTGGSPASVIFADRPARVQHITAGADRGSSYEWGAKIDYRFQYEADPGDPLITKGMVVRVTEARRNPRLSQLSFQVVPRPGSDHAALGTIDATTEAANVGS